MQKIKTKDDDLQLSPKNPLNDAFSQKIKDDFHVEKIHKGNFIDFDVDLDDESILIEHEIYEEKTQITEDHILKIDNQIKVKKIIDYNHEIRNLID